MKLGINLFSLRKQISSPETFESTLARLADLGYDFVQLSGASLPPEAVRDASKKTGLPVVLTHAPWARISGDPDALIAEHAVFGCRDIGLGAAPREALGSAERADAFVGEIARLAEYFAARGVRLLYHNHNFEFARLGGKVFFDRLIEEASALAFIPDTYWFQLAGKDVGNMFVRLAGRMPFVHLKDLKLDYMTPRFAALSDGNLDLPALIGGRFPAARKSFSWSRTTRATIPIPSRKSARA